MRRHRANLGEWRKRRRSIDIQDEPTVVEVVAPLDVANRGDTQPVDPYVQFVRAAECDSVRESVGSVSVVSVDGALRVFEVAAWIRMITVRSGSPFL